MGNIFTCFGILKKNSCSLFAHLHLHLHLHLHSHLNSRSHLKTDENVFNKKNLSDLENFYDDNYSNKNNFHNNKIIKEKINNYHCNSEYEFEIVNLTESDDYGWFVFIE
jgi:hypothetical protein